MYLALQITGPQAAGLGPNASKVFGEIGGTIGRSPGNDWVLADDERFISGRHAIIRFMNSMFSLEDVSTNGVFINDQPQALGSGNPVILKTGDRVLIGDFEAVVSIVEDPSDGVAIPSAAPANPYSDPMVTSPTSAPTSPTATSATPAPSSIGPVDPLDLLNAPPPAPAQPIIPASFSDHSAASSDHFMPPGPAAPHTDTNNIPDDWDLTDFTGKGASPSADAAAPTPAMPPSAPIPPAPMQAGAPPPNYAGAEGAFEQIMPMIVQGMMDVLKSRAEIKSQFRLALTTIKPVENNPLKFSPNAQDAMNHLFNATNPGYLGPAQAFEEGFNDIKAHQMAMIAGMRAAFEHMLEQFSPEMLEERFEGSGKRGGLMKMANKVRYWDMYREMFERISRDSDDNFRKLFGEEFASAYEEQMQKITRGL